MRGARIVAFLGVLRLTTAIVPYQRPGGYPGGLIGLKADSSNTKEDEGRKKKEKTEAPTWEELKARVQDGRFEEFSRDPAVQKKYAEFLDLVRQDWHSVEDMIVSRVYEIDQITMSNGKLRAFRSWDTEPPRRIIKDNDFPYLVPADVEHKVYWCTRLEYLDKAWIEQFVRRHYPNHHVLCWVNPTHLRSFPMVPHAHLLLRPTSAASDTIKKNATTCNKPDNSDQQEEEAKPYFIYYDPSAAFRGES